MTTTTLSRIQAARRVADTMPAPPPSSNPSIDDEDTGPASRVDSRRRDTLPAPPPEHDGVVDGDEEPPSTEKTPFAVEQAG